MGEVSRLVRLRDRRQHRDDGSRRGPVEAVLEPVRIGDTRTDRVPDRQQDALLEGPRHPGRAPSVVATVVTTAEGEFVGVAAGVPRSRVTTSSATPHTTTAPTTMADR